MHVHTVPNQMKPISLWSFRLVCVCKLIFIALVITKSSLQQSIVDGNSLHQKWWLSTLSPWTRDYNVNMHDWQHIKRWIFLSVKNFVLVLVEEMCVWSI